MFLPMRFYTEGAQHDVSAQAFVRHMLGYQVDYAEDSSLSQS